MTQEARSRRSAAVLVMGTIVLVWAWLAAPARGDVSPGFDLFETDPQVTNARFGPPQTTIPANFFDPGSDQFTGVVPLGGVPLETFGGFDSGDADTVVRRTETAVSPQDTVPIEIVALNLVSVAPITVTYNGGQNHEPWEVAVTLSPTAPPPGQITIFETAPGAGGDFQSQFQVRPLITFTRYRDGAQRAIDASTLPPSFQNQFNFQAANVPWAPGCTEPALRIATVNEFFCPVLTPPPPPHHKGLAVFQANAASHGVRPVQARLEHFKCYTLERKGFRRQNVVLQDQFGQRSARVKKRAELCNPVQKNQEPFVNRRAHLQCYKTAGQDADLQRAVAVQNQFGSQQLLVRKPTRLCVPTEKRKKREQFKPIAFSIDHFHCFNVDPLADRLALSPVTSVDLKDQFDRERNVKVGDPVQMCNPAAKNNEPMEHPVRHLVCYRIRDEKVQVAVKIRNQFERKGLNTKRPNMLCVPSNKQVL